MNTCSFGEQGLVETKSTKESKINVKRRDKLFEVKTFEVNFF